MLPDLTEWALALEPCRTRAGIGLGSHVVPESAWTHLPSS